MTNQGHTCSQIFVGLNSDFWATYPLKTESTNGEALQDYTRTHGCPNIIRTDNAQSELGKTWTKHCQTHVIGTETTETHHPWQNPAEKRIGYLSTMVKNVMRQFNVPLSRHHWAQKWCCDVYRFHVWEPIWYYEPRTTQHESSLKKARWLGLAHSTGDAMTYLIETERDDDVKRNVILVNTIIRTRRKNIGTTTKHTNDDPGLADFSSHFLRWRATRMTKWLMK